MDGHFLGNLIYSMHGVYYGQEIEEFTTKGIDPTFSSDHTVDLGVTKGLTLL